MRRFSLLAALLLPLLLPGAVSAGGCPAGVPEGVVEKDVYGLGEIVDFFDSYHDFADPGTVTITFERRSDGLTREYTAFNGPDGTWYRQVTFDSAADAGQWDVTVVVDQTDALDTCTDTLTLRARASLPPTDMRGENAVTAQASADVRLPLASAGLSVLIVLLTRRSRRNGTPT